MRYGARTWSRRPALALACMLSLALGIGANTTIFSMINAVFLRPLEVEEPERLVAVYTRDEQNPGLLPLSRPNYLEARDQNDVFTDLLIYQRVSLDLSTGGEPIEISGQLVSGNYFDLLGVPAAVGRTFLPQEDRTPGSHPVVVLSHELWQSRFAADPGVAGRTLVLNRHPFTIVGVAPAGFTGTDLERPPALWVPSMAYPLVLWEGSTFRDAFDQRRALFFQAIGRLRPGVSLEAAREAMKILARHLEAEYPDDNRGRSLALEPLTQAFIDPDPTRRGSYRLAFGLLLAVSGVVLVVGCGNVGNLLLAQAVAREPEMCLRQALGGGRGRLVRQALTESAVLSLVSGGLGLLLAPATQRLLLALEAPPVLPVAQALRLDLRVLAFTLGLSLLTGLLVGLVSVLHASRTDLMTGLKGLPATGAPARWYAGRHLLVVAQVALSLVSLIVAGLFLKSLQTAVETDPGFPAEQLAIVQLTVGAQGYQPAEGLAFYDRVLERAARLPGVEAVALGRALPLSGGHRRWVVFAEDGAAGSGEGGVIVAGSVVTPGYFESLGIPRIAGRGFDGRDGAVGARVAVVNQTLAESLWPGQDPLGKRIRFHGDEEERRVVGVVADSKYFAIQEEARSYLYLPLAQSYTATVTLFVRTARPASLVPSLQQAVQGLNPALPLRAGTMAEIVTRSLWAPRMGSSLIGIFGLLALVLAALGIFGLSLYTVGRRSREIGVRMALGASRWSVLRLILSQGMVRVGSGLALGLALALATTRSVEALLFGVSAVDGATFAAAALLLSGVAVLANLLPAHRATGIDPVAVLRQG